jgi:hypothetical protein
VAASSAYDARGSQYYLGAKEPDGVWYAPVPCTSNAEACGWDEPPSYLIRDRDGAYGAAFMRRRRSDRHLLASYQEYYNEVRTHLSLHKDAPIWREVCRTGRVLPLPVLGLNRLRQTTVTQTARVRRLRADEGGRLVL